MSKFLNSFQLLLPGEVRHYWPVSLRLACIYSHYWSLGDLELIFILGTDITIYQKMLLL